MITLYHGTSIKNADKIMKKGFAIRKDEGNWKEEYISKEDFVYFTSAYPFFYGSNASGEKDKKASVIKIEIDEEYLYPDEDFLIQASGSKMELNTEIDIDNYKHYGMDSLNKMGNVAIKDLDEIKIISRKDFDIVEMALWCDPCMSIMNFMIMGEYYKTLTKNWFNGKKWKVEFMSFLNSKNN